MITKVKFARKKFKNKNKNKNDTKVNEKLKNLPPKPHQLPPINDTSQLIDWENPKNQTKLAKDIINSAEKDLDTAVHSGWYVLGSFCVVGILVLFVWWWIRRKRQKNPFYRVLPDEWKDAWYAYLLHYYVKN